MINNSMTSSIQILAEIARLTDKSYELDQKQEAGQQQSLELTYQMISKIGGVNMCLRMLKGQLTSSNETLEKEIIQLKDQQKQEINSLVDSVHLEIRLVAAKVQAIMEQFNSYMIGDFAKANTVSEKDLNLLKTLIVDILKCQDKRIRYPEYEDLEQDLEKPLNNYQKQIVNFPVTAELSLTKTDSVLKAFIEDAHQTYEALKLDLEPLESKCQSLISKKEMMVDFHKKYREKIKLEKFESEGLNSPLKKVYELISSVYRQIEWDKLLTMKPGLYSTYGCLDYIDVIDYSRIHKEGLDKIAKEIKEKMGLIVTNLGSIVNPEVSKEGTKS